MVKENKLHAAVKSNSLPNVLKVLEKYNKQNNRSTSSKSKKLDLDFRDNHGLTVTHHAARNGNLEILEAILIHGCKFDIFDLHGLRPISYACAEGNIKIVDYLLRWGSSPNRINGFEYLTPLHLASMYGYAEIVHLLLHYKADPFALNRENKSPLDLACAYGKYNVINLLFSFTTNLVNKSKPLNTNPNDCYGSRTPHTDQMSRYNRFNPSTNIPSTPKISHRSSSPYGSSNNSSSSGSYYSSDNSKNRFVRNITFGDSNSAMSHNVLRYPVKDIVHSNNAQQAVGHPGSSSNIQSDNCCCPNLENISGSNSSNDLLQNLKETCFAVQAKAILAYNSDRENTKGISFGTGDLITVLKQYHNGVAKGFVTAEGIGSTGIFPSNYIEYINDHKPPACCNLAIERHFLQSPEKTPVAIRGKSSKERPCYLDLDSLNIKHNANANELDNQIDEENGSPILIPPQMSDIRTNTTNSAVKWCNSAMPRCSCDNHLGQLYGKSIPHHHQSPDSPSVSTSDLSYCLSLGPGFISTVNSSTNKRNSIASMDSGRGSATDTKSVVSGSTPASTNCNKVTTSPMYYCSSKNNCQLNSAQCHCRECAMLPATVPVPFHHNEENSCRQNFYQNMSNQDGEFVLPRTNSYSQQVSVDSLYYPCSMISLDETQYSSSGSDRGVDDIMVNWLYFIGLGNYADVLSAAGYDLATLTKATPEDLNASGVTNPKDRQMMKATLNRLSVCDGLPDTMPLTIHEFLDNLRLLQYEDILLKQNFTKIEHLVGLTWEDLADIGVEKLGHQKKLSLAIERLSRLASGFSNSRHQISPPSIDMIRDSPQKYSTVPQSRSFEELPYPTAIMADGDPKDKMHRNCYQSLRSAYNIPIIGGVKSSLLSKSDESVSSATEVTSPRSHVIMCGKRDNRSVSSSTSSCSQESSKDDSYFSQTKHMSSATNFAHDNVGTVRIKKPTISTQIDCDDTSCMQEISAIINNLSQHLSQIS